jgi:hypothetical protein
MNESTYVNSIQGKYVKNQRRRTRRKGRTRKILIDQRRLSHAECRSEKSKSDIMHQQKFRKQSECNIFRNNSSLRKIQAEASWD